MQQRKDCVETIVWKWSLAQHHLLLHISDVHGELTLTSLCIDNLESSAHQPPSIPAQSLTIGRATSGL